MKTSKQFRLSLLYIFSISPGIIAADPTTPRNEYVYSVDFNNIQSQTEVLNSIQRQVNTNKEDLKIILFGYGRALSLDANALKNTNIEFGSAEHKIQEKMAYLEKQGVRFIICKTPTSRKRHYSTSTKSSSVEAELQRLQSQGYICNYTYITDDISLSIIIFLPMNDRVSVIFYNIKF